jgi:glutamate/aspartate transport system permease protein
MHYEFNWGMLLGPPYFDWIIQGILVTCHLALISWCIAFVLGVVIGICRVASGWAPRLIGSVYVELFRNVPLLVQLFLWLYVAPELLPRGAELWWNRLDAAPYLTAVIGISFYTAARIAEQIRSAVTAIPAGQFRAALSTGLTPAQMYRYVIAPYAIRIMVPAITSEFLTTFKNTALALTIGVIEITSTSQKIEGWSFKGIEAYSVASLTYMVTTIAVILGMSWVERRAYIPGLIRRGG